MKTSKLEKFAWVFFALALTTTSVFSQGWRHGNKMKRVNNVQDQKCINYISDLTDEQVSTIEKLEESHQEAMTELRNQRRSTTDVVEKNEIRGEMLNKVDAHKTEVKNVLTADQQKVFNELQTRGNSFKNQIADRNGDKNWTRGKGNRQNFALSGKCGNGGNGKQNVGRKGNCNQNGQKGKGRNGNFRGNGKMSNS